MLSFTVQGFAIGVVLEFLGLGPSVWHLEFYVLRVHSFSAKKAPGFRVFGFGSSGFCSFGVFFRASKDSAFGG